MKNALRSRTIVLSVALVLAACMACKGGGSRSRAPGTPALAPGVSAGSSGERGRVTFQLNELEPRTVRVYVGKKSGEYDMSFELRDIQRMDAVLRAIEPRLAQRLAMPDVYFVALTVVDRRGRESGFSNELRLDTRQLAAQVDRRA